MKRGKKRMEKNEKLHKIIDLRMDDKSDVEISLMLRINQTNIRFSAPRLVHSQCESVFPNQK